VSAIADVGSTRRPAKASAIAWERAWWLPLVPILATQTLLSGRLIPTKTASHDEALYIYSGHQLIYELWHGGGSPFYETFFSGAPVIYPVMAAMADHVGGLAAVRLMSLTFMLMATVVLYATSRQLLGYLPAILGAGLFAGLGITQDLGAYATYDALGVLLIAAAAYCAVRTGDGAHSGRWVVAVPLMLLVANAATYSTLPLDLVVIALAALQRPTWRDTVHRLAILSLTTVLLLAVAALLAGTAYIKGILFTTLTRQGGTDLVIGSSLTASHVIITETLNWTGVMLALGLLAVMMSFLAGERFSLTAVLATLTVAGVLVTTTALRLHSNESMSKHDDAGVWFTCIAAGYALASVTRWARNRYIQATAVALAACAVAMSGIHYSRSAAATYDAGTAHRFLPAFAILKPYLAAPGHRFLVGGTVEDEIPYTDHINIPWWDYGNDVYIKYPIPGRGGDSHGQRPGKVCLTVEPGCMYLEGTEGFRAAIHAHWFALISMIGSHGITQDSTITQAVENTSGYVPLTWVGGAPTWIYAPAYRRMLNHHPA
jgi:hypothetical protein